MLKWEFRNKILKMRLVYGLNRAVRWGNYSHAWVSVTEKSDSFNPW